MEEEEFHISLSALRAGDQAEWSRAYHPLSREVLRVAKANFRPELGIDPEDITQEVIALEVRPGLESNKETFANLRDFGNLLVLSRTIAKRRAIDAIRMVMRRPEYEMPENWEEWFAPDQGACVSIESLERIVALVDRLKPPKPEIFIDHFVFGYTYAEISENRGIPLGAVCSHFYRGLRELRDYLGGDGEGDL